MGGVSSAGGMSQGVVADVLSALVQTGWPRRRRTIIPTVLLVPVTILCIMIHNHHTKQRFLWTPLAAFTSQPLNSKKKKTFLSYTCFPELYLSMRSSPAATKRGT